MQLQLQSYTALASLLGLAAASNNLGRFCAVEKQILSDLHAVPTASSFCSRYLHISTLTKTHTTCSTVPFATTTVTVRSTTDTSTATVTVTEQTFSAPTTVTVTSIGSPTVTVTATTTSTSTTSSPLTCLNSATSLEVTTTTIVKRTQAAVALKTPGCLKPLPSRIISQACSCLHIPTPSTSTTTTRTETSGTATTTSIIFTQLTTTVTVTATPFSTSTYTVTSNVPTSTDTTTTTATATATVAALPNKPGGLNWYMYQSSYDYDAHGQSNDAFDPSVFAAMSPILTGQGLGDFSTFKTATYPTWDSLVCSPPGSTEDFDCSHVAVVYEGFLWASQGAGAYKLSTPGVFTDSSQLFVDDLFYVWSGPNAYQVLTAQSADYVAKWSEQDGAYTYDLDDGEFIPIVMLWANTLGPGRAVLQVTSPTGAVTDFTSVFLPACGKINDMTF